MTGFQQNTRRPRIVEFLYYNFLLHFFYFHPSLPHCRRDLERRKTYRLGITPVDPLGSLISGGHQPKTDWCWKRKKYLTHWYLLLPWNLVQESLNEIRNLSYFPYFFLFKGLVAVFHICIFFVQRMAKDITTNVTSSDLAISSFR
jgi:hypothetical protein